MWMPNHKLVLKEKARTRLTMVIWSSRTRDSTHRGWVIEREKMKSLISLITTTLSLLKSQRLLMANWTHSKFMSRFIPLLTDISLETSRRLKSVLDIVRSELWTTRAGCRRCSDQSIVVSKLLSPRLPPRSQSRSWRITNQRELILPAWWAVHLKMVLC